MKQKLSVNSKTQQVFKNVVEKLKDIVNNGEYEKFLKFQKNFNGYSFNNLILIFSQFPEATIVAGKAKWQKLNRELIDNAKKIFIIAPIPIKYQKRVKQKLNDDEIEDTVTIEYNKYKYVYVYDISQTKGEPIPLQCEDINCDDKAYFYQKLKRFSEYPVLEKKLQGGIL